MDPDRRTARDLMEPRFATVSASLPLREAVRDLLAERRGEGPGHLRVVIDDAGRCVGILTARSALSGLLSPWDLPEELAGDRARLESLLFERVLDRATEPVASILPARPPTIAPGARLIEMIESAGAQEIEALVVVEDERPIGLVPIQELYYQVARMTLTPEDEGIR